MNANRLSLTSFPGRLVAVADGVDLVKPSLTDMHGKPRPKPQYFFRVAIPKTTPGINEQLVQIAHFAHQAYAQYPFIQQRILPPAAPGHPQYYSIGRKGTQFAFKIDDGDVPNQRGKIGEGYAGCWIFNFATTLPLRCINRENVTIGAENFRLGCFVDVAFNVEPNGKLDHTAGIYLNPNFVRLLGYGQEIQRGPTAEEAFANAPAQLPPGASMTPLAPGGAPGGFHGQSGGLAAPAPSHAAHGPVGGIAPGHGHVQHGQHQAAMGNGQAPTQNTGGFSPGLAAPASPGMMPANNGGAVAGNPQPGLPPMVAHAGNAVVGQQTQQGSVSQMAPGAVTTASPSEGNGAPGQAVPAVPGGALHAPSMSPAPSPESASPSSFQPHPAFVHGGQAA